MNVEAWLRELGLEEYAGAFAAQHVDATVLASLTDADLKELGVASLGHRKKLLAAIARIAAPAAPAAEPPSPGERRPVTVLFADLAGYTALSRRLDAEDVHAILDRYFATADAIVADFGGTVDKHIGDCVMAVFGAPRAHSDDAERALRAALAIRDAMPALARELRQDLAMHAGIASGEVVAGRTGSDAHRPYTVIGESVNLASRLADRAGTGEILISEAVRAALGARIAVDALEPLALDGFAQPAAAFRLRGFIAAPAAQVGTLIGRRVETEQFRRAAELARDSGRGAAVHVRGEAGIGKSRLVAEFRTIARALGFADHAAVVLDFGAGAERDAIRALVRSLIGGDDAGAVDRAHDRGWIDADARMFVHAILGLALPPALRLLHDTMDHAARLRGRIAAVAGLVEGASRAGPQLLVVEDVHWANRLTLDHLARLTETAANCPALLVVTSRIEGDPLGTAWRARTGGATLITIDLGPLRPDDARALAAAQGGIEPALAERCVARANGNPLFLEQLVRHARDNGADIPPSVHSVVLARLDRLAPADKRALQAAAVLGQRFALDALRHVVADDRYLPAALVDHLLVRPDGDEIEIIHALVRDGVYASLLRPTAHELHRRAAVWYRERDLAVHAEHLERAQDAGAAAAYRAAAAAELRAYRPDAALALAERGARCAGMRHDRQALAAIKGEILLDLGTVPAAIEAFGQALELADDDATRCAARLGLAACMRLVDRYDDAFAALDLAQQEATRADLPAALAQIHHLRGNLFFPKGRIADCLAEHEAALAFAERSGSPELKPRALGGLGDGEYARGRYRSAARRFAECVALARAHGLGKIDAANRNMLAFCCWFDGDLATARSEASDAVALAERLGHHRAELVARHLQIMMAIGEMRFDDARAHVARARALTARIGAMRFEAENLFFLAEIELRTGRRGEASRLAREAMTISRATSIGYFGPSVLGGLVRATDDAQEREAALAEGERLLQAGAVSHNHFFFYRDASDAMLATGETGRARDHAARLAAYTAQERLPWSDFIVGRIEALARRAEGERSAALLRELAELESRGRALGLLSMLPEIAAARAGLAAAAAAAGGDPRRPA